MHAGAKQKISEFRVTGLKILDREGTYIFFVNFFSGKKYFMHFERHNAFQMHKIIFFFEKT